MIIPHTCKPGPCPLCVHNAKQGLVTKQEVGTSSGCCGTTYWCVDGVPVGVEADGLGVYYPPEGATGDPYPTFEDALEFGCPPQDVLMECGGYTYIYPGNVMLSLVNATGVLQNGSRWAEFLYPIYSPISDQEKACSHYFNTTTGNALYCDEDMPSTFDLTNGLKLIWGISMVPSGPGAMLYDGNIWQRILLLVDDGLPCYGFLSPNLKLTGDNGWPTFGPWVVSSAASTRTVTGTDGRFLVPTRVGLLEVFEDGVVVGSADVYIQGGG